MSLKELMSKRPIQGFNHTLQNQSKYIGKLAISSFIVIFIWRINKKLNPNNS